MNPSLKSSLSSYLLSLADDELILGHRNSEWCGHAPILEEDIAFANIALDEIGHAQAWYSLLAELQGEDPGSYPDRLVFHRDPEDFRSAQFVELPRGDWAFSMLRQFLFDALERVRLESMQESAYPPLAQVAAKIRSEEIYHYRHTEAWVRRLALGTDESHNRIQKALEALWDYLPALFTLTPGEEALISARIIQPADIVYQVWASQLLPFLKECSLELPEENVDRMREAISAKDALEHRDIHTPYLKVLVTEMQTVAREEPQAIW